MRGSDQFVILCIFAGDNPSPGLLQKKCILKQRPIRVLFVYNQSGIMNGKVEEFNDYRAKMNERILAADSKIIKRIYNIDTNAYSAGALDIKTKEMLGLVSSLVLRCDDCIKYHLIKCHENGVSEEELFEILGIGTLVGGTIVIPHMRRAVEFWDEIKSRPD
jgi:AhpD family alkylhydroperoxidase